METISSISNINTDELNQQSDHESVSLQTRAIIVSVGPLVLVTRFLTILRIPRSSHICSVSIPVSNYTTLITSCLWMLKGSKTLHTDGNIFQSIAKNNNIRNPEKSVNLFLSHVFMNRFKIFVIS